MRPLGLEMAGAGMRIKKWDELQHHRDGRRMHWAKLHRKLLRSKAWRKSNDSQKFDMLVLILFSMEECMDGGVPDDPDDIKDICRIGHSPNLEHLLEVGFLAADQEEEIRRDKSIRSVAQPGPSRPNLAQSGTGAEFQRFWETYPKKRGKKAAAKAWTQAKDRPGIDVILAAIAAAKASPDWTKDGGQYIPLPATWLNQGRWADEYETAAAPAPATSSRGSMHQCPSCHRPAPTFVGSVCTTCAKARARADA